MIINEDIYEMFKNDPGNAEERAQQSIIDWIDSYDDDEKRPFNAEISFDIFNSVVHVSHLVFHSDLIFEFDLPVLNAIKAHSVFETSINFTKYYRTLFRSIISPNAP